MSAIPDSIRCQATEWNLVLGDRLAGATCSDVFAASDIDGGTVVLKIPHEIAEEKDALSTSLAFSPVGGVEILRSNEESSAILMPQLHPGKTLDSVFPDDESSLPIMANAILRLRTAEQAKPKYDLEGWYSGRKDEGNSPIIVDALEIADRLMKTTTWRGLLHGDLHHGNLLQHGDQWVVIDPKGIWGDPAFEVTAYMRNPIREISTDEARWRLLEFHDLLGDPLDRLWGWAFSYNSQTSNASSMGTVWTRSAANLWALKSEFWPG